MKRWRHWSWRRGIQSTVSLKFTLECPYTRTGYKLKTFCPNYSSICFSTVFPWHLRWNMTTDLHRAATSSSTSQMFSDCAAHNFSNPCRRSDCSSTSPHSRPGNRRQTLQTRWCCRSDPPHNSTRCPSTLASLWNIRYWPHQVSQ